MARAMQPGMARRENSVLFALDDLRGMESERVARENERVAREKERVAREKERVAREEEARRAEQAVREEATALRTALGEAERRNQLLAAELGGVREALEELAVHPLAPAVALPEPAPPQHAWPIAFTLALGAALVLGALLLLRPVPVRERVVTVEVPKPYEVRVVEPAPPPPPSPPERTRKRHPPAPAKAPPKTPIFDKNCNDPLCGLNQ
jgi:hypothetical protein